MEFEWDPIKATSNLQKHAVSFNEATSVFGDPLSITVPDPDHSLDENRFIIVGLSHLGHLLIVAHSERDERIRLISVRKLTPHEKKLMKKEIHETDDELRPEYDLKNLLKDGVRGKYVERYQSGTNLVLLSPDVARAFPSDEAVNEALRLVMQMAKLPIDSKQIESSNV